MKDNLELAIEKLAVYEKQHRRRIFYFSVISIIFASFFLYISTITIKKYSTKIQELTIESNLLTRKVESLNHSKDSLNQILLNLKAFSEFSTKWDLNDISLKDSTRIRIAMRAHQQLIQLASTEKLNPNLSIRYYLKHQDQYPHYNRIQEEFKRNRVQNSLRRVGYRAIDINSTSYRNGTPTNVIYYSKEISVVDLKVVAFALLRAGIEIKSIQRYPKSISKRKPNSIEISSKKSLVDEKPISIEEVVNLKLQN